jgi:hypothetical protein
VFKVANHLSPCHRVSRSETATSSRSRKTEANPLHTHEEEHKQKTMLKNHQNFESRTERIKRTFICWCVAIVLLLMMRGEICFKGWEKKRIPKTIKAEVEDE